MAVPSSGAISMLSIYNELAENNYSSGTSRSNVSLKDMSDGTVATINTSNDAADRPDGSAPHNMSEFYNYDHDLSAGTSFSSIYTFFSISTTAVNQTQFSDLKTFVISNGSGNLTITIGSVAPNTGVLSVAASVVGDPGTTSGTDNSGTGFVSEAISPSITLNTSWGSSKTVRLRFKYVGHSSATSPDQRTVTLANNGVTASAGNINLATNASKSDRRLKTNIERIGHSDMNIPIYLFNFKDNLNTTYKGVMAQDLLELGFKDSVVLDSDGYYSVKYNTIDVDMEMI